jgi:glycosyltransferase involved in cell wall biosynthesis
VATPKAVHVTTVHRALDSRILFKECISLRQAGYQVVLIAPHPADEVIEGVQIRALPPARGRLDRMRRLTRIAADLCRRERGDVYHLHDAELLPRAPALRRLGGHVIYDMHECMPKALAASKPYLPRWAAPLVSRVYTLFERFWLRGVAVIFAELSYKEGYRWVKRHVDVLNLPDVGQLQAIVEPKNAIPTVCYFGLVAELRSSWEMVRAVQLLRDEGLRVDFDCIGPIDDKHLSELRQYVEQNQLDGVRLRGFMAVREGHSVIARCQIGLAVVYPTPNMRDSFPTKMFEYMALGMPVIVSDFPLYRGIVDEAGCGLCVEPGDVKALAAAIRRLIDNPAEARAMGERGRRTVLERYNWATEERKLLGFYEQLLAE